MAIMPSLQLGGHMSDDIVLTIDDILSDPRRLVEALRSGATINVPEVGMTLAPKNRVRRKEEPNK
jgi:hypothetical protein